MKTTKTTPKHVDKRGDPALLKRRIIASAALVFVAGFATLSAFVWTRDTSANTAFDPFYNLNTSSPKVRIFQPLQKSLDNPSSVVANGQAPAGSTVTLRVDGNQVGTTVANDKGLWSRTISNLADGERELTASATINGPLSLVTSNNFAPGFGFLDLQTNAITSAYNTGVATAFFISLGQYSGVNDVVSAYNVVTPENNDNAYVIRRRSVAVVDIATQRPVQAVSLGQLFVNEQNEDNNQNLTATVFDQEQSKIYLLFSNEQASQIITFNTQTNSVDDQLSLSSPLEPAANRMLLANGKLYLFDLGTADVQSIDVASGNVSTITTQSSPFAVARSNDGTKVYVSEQSGEDNTMALSEINTADDSIQNAAINLGPFYSGDGVYSDPSGERLYVLSNINSDLRIVDIASSSVVATVNLQANPNANDNAPAPVFNTDGSRIYIPLQDNRVAIVNTQSNSLVGHVNVPGQNYAGLYGLMYNENKIYTTYSRNLDPTDITNLSQLFNSIGISNANATSSVTPQMIAGSGTASTFISPPIAIAPQTYVGTSQFSVGEPLAITSPATNASLNTSTPTITGKGPRNKTIQLIVNNGTPIDIAVNSDGNWQRQITLPKDQFSKIIATYSNKRTQVVIPNQTILGGNIAKSELSIIDGESALQQQGINLGDLGLQNARLNTTAAINPNGQRYYTLSIDATSILATVLDTVISSNGTEAPDPVDIASILNNAQIGTIGVYSAQSRQSVASIQLPNGTVPLGITVSPDGKKAAVLAFDIPTFISLIQGGVPIDDSTPAPAKFHFLNLENNTVDGEAVQPNFDLGAFANSEVDAMQAIQTYLSLGGSVAYALGRPGNFNANGSKFYTSGFAPGQLSVIDMSSRQLETLDLPSQYDLSIIMNTQFNKSNGVLYATYLTIVPPANESDPPSFTPGLMLINTQNNQIIGQSAIPDLPLFNFAISPSGTKMYFITANYQDFIDSLLSSGPNAVGVLADVLPEFRLGVYDLNIGSYDRYAITNTEVPISLALSSDGSRVFIPTIASNVLHVFDTATNEMNPGNAPVILPGVSLMFGSGDFANDAVIGAYTAEGDYYVPADAPVTPPSGGGTTVVQNNVGSTQFRFLPAAQQNAITPQPITIPQQTVRTVQQTVERAVDQQRQAQVQQVQRTWLIYIFYVALMAALGAIAVTIWRTDMVLGRNASDDLFA